MKKIHKEIEFKKVEGIDPKRGAYVGWESTRYGGKILEHILVEGAISAQPLPKNLLYDEAWRRLVHEIDNAPALVSALKQLNP